MIPAILSLISFAAAAHTTHLSLPDTVKIETGLISGLKNQTGDVSIFKGIPFAAPPVGNLRWRPPQPAVPWQGIRKCDSFAASAMQPKPFPISVYSTEFLAPQSPISEDCLYLNVWAPAQTSSTKYPVIVWIHGGGFLNGSGSVPLYDGEDMAQKGVVFVTINYRLGVFGFLAHPDLSKESGNGTSGNYALLDQIEALKWVRRNIAAFGGDTERITVAGQSAGSFSVNALVASPLTKGLFQRAIAESGAMFYPEFSLNLKEAEKIGIKYMQDMKATSIADLRAKPADEFLKGWFNNIPAPVIDGYVLPMDVYNIFLNGKQNDVPVLTGWNSGDGSLFFLTGMQSNAKNFKAKMQERYGLFSDDFFKAFPANSDTQALQSQVALFRDLLFAWKAHVWANLQTLSGKSKIFLYQFDHVPPGKPGLEKLGAFHSAEIGYALHTLHKWDRPWGDWDRKLEDMMSAYWVNFAATGDPNGKGLPGWPAYDRKNPKEMNFGSDVSVKENLLKKEFDFLDKFQANGNP